MAVQLELVGGVVTFSPPLTPHSSLPSIPEIVAKWMDSYVATTHHLPRVLPNIQVSGSCMYPLTYMCIQGSLACRAHHEPFSCLHHISLTSSAYMKFSLNSLYIVHTGI